MTGRNSLYVNDGFTGKGKEGEVRGVRKQPRGREGGRSTKKGYIGAHLSSKKKGPQHNIY